MGRTKKLGLALTREQPLLPGDPQGVEGPQGGGAEAVGEGSGGARAGSTQGGGRAVWSSWQEILGSDAASDIGNLQALGDEGEGEDREGGQEETDGAISQEEEEDEPEPMEIDMDVD